MSVWHGLVLAAGAGRRYGGPKALARTADGEPWVARTVAALRAGGCARVVVALGADAERARPLVPPGTDVVVVGAWRAGVSAAVRDGLAAATSAASGVPAGVVIVPVDVPDLPAAVVARAVAAAAPLGRAALVRAVYDGRPGHPVVIGAAHVSAVSAQVHGDRGAGPYLAAHRVTELECGDLWSGVDRDEP